MANQFALRSKTIITPDGTLDGYVTVSGTAISEIREGEIPEAFAGEVYDVGADMVVPGFIDLHIHGAGGWLVDDDPEHVARMARILADFGVTSYFPTTMTQELERFKGSLRAVKKAMDSQGELMEQGQAVGAEMLGIHLEGPFLNPKKKGAMPEEHLQKPSVDLMKEFEEAAGGKISRVTVAPELPGADELIAYLKKQGYLIAGGHTTCTSEQMKKAIDEGVTIANHMYNAMTSLHHREPGAVGRYLTDDRVTCELIGDGVHVHPTAMDIVLRCKGLENVYLISDAVMGSGLPAGKYDWGGRTITIDEEGRTTLPDGTIAGSTCMMIVGFKNLIELLDLSLEDAVTLVSANPARVAGVSDRKGSLEAGKDADIAVIGRGYEVKYCFVHGTAQKTPAKSSRNLIRTDLS